MPFSERELARQHEQAKADRRRELMARLIGGLGLVLVDEPTDERSLWRQSIAAEYVARTARSIASLLIGPRSPDGLHRVLFVSGSGRSA